MKRQNHTYLETWSAKYMTSFFWFGFYAAKAVPLFPHQVHPCTGFSYKATGRKLPQFATEFNFAVGVVWKKLAECELAWTFFITRKQSMDATLFRWFLSANCTYRMSSPSPSIDLIDLQRVKPPAVPTNSNLHAKYNVIVTKSPGPVPNRSWKCNMQQTTLDKCGWARGSENLVVVNFGNIYPPSSYDEIWLFLLIDLMCRIWTLNGILNVHPKRVRRWLERIFKSVLWAHNRPLILTVQWLLRNTSTNVVRHSRIHTFTNLYKLSLMQHDI